MARDDCMTTTTEMAVSLLYSDLKSEALLLVGTGAIVFVAWLERCTTRPSAPIKTLATWKNSCWVVGRAYSVSPDVGKGCATQSRSSGAGSSCLSKQAGPLEASHPTTASQTRFGLIGIQRARGYCKRCRKWRFPADTVLGLPEEADAIPGGARKWRL